MLASDRVAMPKVNQETLADFPLPYTDQSTQRVIANFLDRKTAAIDALISEKEKLIERLEELRASIVHRAVTRGLDPTVELKDSGVAWIGEVPRHWDTALLRLLARIESGHTPSRSHPEYWIPSECTIPWFSLADVWQLRDGTQKYLGETTECISELGMANSAARLLPPNTVVLSRTASVGFSGIMPRPMATTQDFVNWVPTGRLVPDYLMWTFRAMKPEFDRLMMGSTHKTIYMPDVRQMRGPVPPLQEQEAIAKFLDATTGQQDEMQRTVREQINRLKEYRQSLITHAVTGQMTIEELDAQPTPTDEAPPTPIAEGKPAQLSLLGE